ncbi:MAG: SDR family NAD(P)-dependent oxidoreductase [Caulobacteraceae bacterium]
MTSHPALVPGHVAVVTGAANGIGLAAARRFAALGLKVCLADLPGEALDAATVKVTAVAKGGADDVMSQATDVGGLAAVEALKAAVYARFGAVHVLMNNAGVGKGGGAFSNLDGWTRVLGVNLWGVINGVQTFTADMIAQGAPGLIINTGSKQGITTPPGDTAYNVSKAGVKVLTEGLQHELRNADGCQITAHLLVPGFTYTGMTGRPEKPDAAWTADQVVDELLRGIEAGRFYIICPDNDVTSETDRKRIQWAAEDVIQNRPPLSRWHPDYKDAFAAFMAADE